MELQSLEYEPRGRNAEDTKREGNNLNKESSITRKVRVTTRSSRDEVGRRWFGVELGGQ